MATAARAELPSGIADTPSAFASTDGGLVLLGVAEGSAAFPVTGVEDPRRATAALQAAAEQMEPPLRSVIDVVARPDGAVVTARVPPVPRDERPCHRRSGGPCASSFVRFGDASDQELLCRFGVLAGSAGRSTPA
ncbi:MAG: hypothetical protein M0Z33_01670 [Actinomycetota bacterium]|nr:hypothetical protein [Actinomycetota bacterium]